MIVPSAANASERRHRLQGGSAGVIGAAGLLVWIIQSSILWLGGAPLGHDEAQYAIAGQDLLDGHDPRWFYLSTGMSWIAALGHALGGSDVAMRFPTFLLGIAFILTVAQLARWMFGPVTAAWTVAVLAGARGIVTWSTALLSDMPAALCLLCATWVLAGELLREDERARWRIVLAAPLLAGAFYLRFASCVPIAILGVALVVVAPRAIVRNAGRLGVTVLVFASLLIPHAVTAHGLTGAPWGILLESKSVPGASLGLVGYLTHNPFMFYGVLMPIPLVAGLLAVTLRRTWRDRRALLMWMVGVANIVAIGLITDAQARYIMYGLTLLAMLGVDVIRHLSTARSYARSVQSVAVVSVTIAWLITTIGSLRLADSRRHRMMETLIAAEAIRHDRIGACYVFGYHYTQLEWYSGCSSREVSFTGAIAESRRVYVVYGQHKGWQPQPSDYPDDKLTILDLPGVVRVERFGPDAPASR